MSNQHSGMFIPALVGGAVAGVLMAIPLVNCLCCLWIIGGAMLASYLLARNSTASLTSGDGAIVGVFAGIVAAVVEAFVSLPFQALNQQFLRRFMEQLSQFTEDMPSGWEKWLDIGRGGISPAWFLLSLVISMAVFAVFGALGGVIGASLFGKKKPLLVQGTKDETPQGPSDRQPGV
jgi:uncharacterized protein involved in cysteine biosynthesis